MAYFGRTNRSLSKRLDEHRGMINQRDTSSALVRHSQSHPGHNFDMDAASLVWKTNDKLESKLVESTCIKILPSCNVATGEVFVGPTMASVISKVANLQKLVTANSRTPRDSATLYTATLHNTTANNLPPPSASHLISSSPPSWSPTHHSTRSPPSIVPTSPSHLLTSSTPLISRTPRPQRPPRPPRPRPQRPPRSFRPPRPSPQHPSRLISSPSAPTSTPPHSQSPLLFPNSTPQPTTSALIQPIRLNLQPAPRSPTTTMSQPTTNSSLLPVLSFKRRPALSQQEGLNSPQMKLRFQPTQTSKY